MGYVLGVHSSEMQKIRGSVKISYLSDFESHFAILSQLWKVSCSQYFFATQDMFVACSIPMITFFNFRPPTTFQIIWRRSMKGMHSYVMLDYYTKIQGTSCLLSHDFVTLIGCFGIASFTLAAIFRSSLDVPRVWACNFDHVCGHVL